MHGTTVKITSNNFVLRLTFPLFNYLIVDVPFSRKFYILKTKIYIRGPRKIWTQSLHQTLLKLTGNFKMQIDMNFGKVHERCGFI